MPIVSTEKLGAGTWSDGIHLRAKFTDHTGKQYPYAHIVPNDTDLDAFLAARVVKLNLRMIEGELQRAVTEMTNVAQQVALVAQVIQNPSLLW